MTSSAPIVDIMLPFWGDPSLLFEAVRSVQEQTDPGWRLVVVDDAYPDSSVAAHFAALTDERIVYVRNTENLGIIANFATCARLAEAPWMVMLGSDDKLRPQYVAELRAAQRRAPDADVIAFRVETIDEHGRPHRPLADRIKRFLTPARTQVLSGSRLVASLMKGNWLYWPSLALRTRRVQHFGFRDDLPIILDLALIMEIAFSHGRLLFVSGDPTFDYRRHSSSLSQKTISDGVRFADERRFHREIAMRARQLGWRRAAVWAALRPSSRLHAMVALPSVLASGNAAALRASLRNALLP